MARQPFDRRILNLRERPNSPDHNYAQAQLDRALREVLRKLFASPSGTAQNGFMVDGFKVVPTSPAGMSVQVSAGIGFQDNPSDLQLAVSLVEGLDDLAPYKPLYLSTPEGIAIDAAPSSGQSRIDIIEVRNQRLITDISTREVLNPSNGQFDTPSVYKTMTWDLTGTSLRVEGQNSYTAIGYKVGTPATTGTQTAPATSPGYIKIAEILVNNGDSTVVAGAITDFRPQLLTGPVVAGFPGWQSAGLNSHWASIATQRPFGYYKDALGIVHLRGVLQGDGTNNTPFVLPVGYRPAGDGQTLPVIVGNSGYYLGNLIIVASTGVVGLDDVATYGGGATGISAAQIELSGISFTTY